MLLISGITLTALITAAQRSGLLRKYPRLQFLFKVYLLLLCFGVGSVLGICTSLYCWANGTRSNANHYAGLVFYRLCRYFLGVRCEIVDSSAREDPQPITLSDLPASTLSSEPTSNPSFDDKKLDAALLKCSKTLSSKVPCVLICNHQSTIDLVCMASFWPNSTCVIVKEAVKWYPLLGWHLWLAMNIFIQRSDRLKAIETMNVAALTMIQRKVGVFLFPEGTRSHAMEPDLLPFKKGAFHMALKAKVPIIPIVISNYSNIYSSRKMRFNDGLIPISVLEPISTEEYTNETISELMGKCERTMKDELTRLKAQTIK